MKLRSLQELAVLKAPKAPPDEIVQSVLKKIATPSLAPKQQLAPPVMESRYVAPPKMDRNLFGEKLNLQQPPSEDALHKWAVWFLHQYSDQERVRWYHHYWPQSDPERARAKLMGARKGCPDLHFWGRHTGKVAFMELKSPNGPRSLSVEQEEWRADCEANGTQFAVCNTKELCIETWRRWNVLRKGV